MEKKTIIRFVIGLMLVCILGAGLYMAFYIHAAVSFWNTTPMTVYDSDMKNFLESRYEVQIPDSVRWEKIHYDNTHRDNSWKGIFTIPEEDLQKLFPEERFTWHQPDSLKELQQFPVYSNRYFEGEIPLNTSRPDGYRIISLPPGARPTLYGMSAIVDISEGTKTANDGKVTVWFDWS